MIDWKYPLKGENPPLVKGCKILAALCFDDKMIGRVETMECLEHEGKLFYQHDKHVIVAWVAYNEPEILPMPDVCPYCGCENIAIENYIDKRYFYARCEKPGCTYFGPPGYTKQEAIANHNKVLVKE